MSIVIARSATKLSSQRTSLQCSQLTLQTVNKHTDFLTQTRRRSRLSMRFGQHRNIGPFFGIRAKLSNQFLNLRIIYLLQRFFYRKGHRGIVDILRSQSEVDKLLVIVHTTQLVKLFFQEIFHGFHVVIGHAFNFLNALGIGFREITINISQSFKHALVYPSQLRQRQFTQSDKILNLDPHSILNKCKFREIGGQGICLAPIATVNRRDGG